jgi:hypothetical protein
MHSKHTFPVNHAVVMLAVTMECARSNNKELQVMLRTKLLSRLNATAVLPIRRRALNQSSAVHLLMVSSRKHKNF